MGGRDFAAALFLVRTMCSSRPLGCCYINISGGPRRLSSWALAPREVTPGSGKRSFWEEVGRAALAWTGCPSALAASQPPPGPHDRCANKRGQKSGVQFRPPAAIPLCPPRRAPCKGCFTAGLQVVPSSCRCSFSTVLHPARSLSAFKAPLWHHLLQKPNQDAGLGGCTPSHGADQPVLG